VRAAFEELVYRAALKLDARDYGGFLALCEPELRYTISTYSPEIRRDMTWLDHDKAGLENLFETLPRQKSEGAALSRHVSVYTVDVDAAGDTADIVTALQVFKTHLDGGATVLLAVGEIYDRARLVAGVARLVRRNVRLDTRDLGIGTHIPI
jgi:methanesulfonate monooxygenase small subunit